MIKTSGDWVLTSLSPCTESVTAKNGHIGDAKLNIYFGSNSKCAHFVGIPIPQNVVPIFQSQIDEVGDWI